MTRVLFIVVLMISLAPAAFGQPGQTDHKEMKAGAAMMIYPAAEVKWQEGLPSLPKGAKFAVLEGDPKMEGLFTMRLWLPDGFSIQPHFHSAVEHVTVVSGTFNVGMGEKFDKAATKEMPVGAFGHWPAGMRHFAWAKGDTVLQLHGMGPWTITYVNPADDPRNAAKKP